MTHPGRSAPPTRSRAAAPRELQDDEWRAPRVLIVVSTLWGASAADRSRLRQAIADRFPASCHPLYDLWLIQTSLAPAEVLDYLEEFLPDHKAGTGKKDGLLVLAAGHRAVESGLERVRKDVGWMWEHGVAVKHRRPPAPVAHRAPAVHRAPATRRAAAPSPAPN